MLKVLDNLVNRKDVLSIIDGFANLYEEDDDEYKTLNSLYKTIQSLVCINIVEAGNLNIVCENPYEMSQYLEGKVKKSE